MGRPGRRTSRRTEEPQQYWWWAHRKIQDVDRRQSNKHNCQATMSDTRIIDCHGKLNRRLRSRAKGFWKLTDLSRSTLRLYSLRPQVAMRRAMRSNSILHGNFSIRSAILNLCTHSPRQLARRQTYKKNGRTYILSMKTVLHSATTNSTYLVLWSLSQG